MINKGRLAKELRDAGLPIGGCCVEQRVRQQHEIAPGCIVTWHERTEGKVRLDWESQPANGQQSHADAIIAAHDGAENGDDILETIRIPAKLLVALVLAANPSPDDDPWVKSAIAQAKARINGTLQGKAPSNGE